MLDLDADVRDELWALLARGMDLPDFDELLARPEWHAHAACRGMGTRTFFPGAGESADDARARCEVCPVIDECRRAAARHSGGFGVWGGVSASQRHRDARSERSARPVPRSAA